MTKPTDEKAKEIVAWNGRDIKGMSDAELLGPDYKDWLKAEKRAVKGTVLGGTEAREGADRVMERSSALIARVEALRDRNG